MARLAALVSWLAASVAVFVMACTGDAPTVTTSAASEPGRAPEPATAKACGPAQQEDLSRSLVGTCTEPSTILVPPLATATWAPVAELEPVGVHVVITPDGVGFGGNDPVAWSAEEFRVRLQEDLDKSREMQEAKGETFTPRFVLAIHRDARLSAIDPVLRELAAAKVDRGFLALASGTRPRTSPPRHPTIYAGYVAELESRDPTERAVYAARKMEPLAKRCPALEVAFRNAATTDGPSRCETLMAAAAAAIVECGCPEYEPELVSWLQVLAGPADAAHLHI